MARTGMADNIATLRGMTDAGTADYTAGTITYWSDNEVQRVLDRHRIDFKREQLVPVASHADGGTIQYKEYRSQFNNIESGTAVFNLELATGEAAGTANYSVDYALGIITFSADQGGTAWYLSARSYDLNASAADIWRSKAGNAAKAYDVKTDGHSLNRSQMMKHCMGMANHYESFAKVSFVDLERDDMA